ncbi:MAG TPA: spore coat U domain-containing protein [Hyphomonadaceae bacterium]|nr:spore coat U domain-containing protein [Hyphomonadaceae bacterium]
MNLVRFQGLAPRASGWLCSILIAATFVFGNNESSAQTATSNFNVTATVQNACTISAADLLFGVYSTISGANLDGSSTIQVKCTLNASYGVALNAGTTAGGTIAARLMTSGATTLGYNLYTTNGRTTVWGDGTGGSSTVSGTGTGLTANLTVYGRIAAAQNIPAGSFSDVVTATISF